MTPTWSYATIRPAHVDGYIAITDGSRHVLARTDGPGVPAGAQRHLNAARTGGNAPGVADLAAVAGWLDEHAVQTRQQGCLFDAA